MDEVEKIIRKFLAEQILPEAEVEKLDKDTPLLQTGILNSLTLIHLIDFLEGQFDLTVSPAEFQPENFQTIHTICDYIQRKRIRG
jgi:acyl carrier protein